VPEIVSSLRYAGEERSILASDCEVFWPHFTIKVSNSVPCGPIGLLPGIAYFSRGYMSLRGLLEPPAVAVRDYKYAVASLGHTIVHSIEPHHLRVVARMAPLIDCAKVILY
jgi:hypothetical protein